MLLFFLELNFLLVTLFTYQFFFIFSVNIFLVQTFLVDLFSQLSHREVWKYSITSFYFCFLINKMILSNVAFLQDLKVSTWLHRYFLMFPNGNGEFEHICPKKLYDFPLTAAPRCYQYYFSNPVLKLYVLRTRFNSEYWLSLGPIKHIPWIC